MRTACSQDFGGFVPFTLIRFCIVGYLLSSPIIYFLRSALAASEDPCHMPLSRSADHFFAIPPLHLSYCSSGTITRSLKVPGDLSSPKICTQVCTRLKPSSYRFSWLKRKFTQLTVNSPMLCRFVLFCFSYSKVPTQDLTFWPSYMFPYDLVCLILFPIYIWIHCPANESFMYFPLVWIL